MQGMQGMQGMHGMQGAPGIQGLQSIGHPMASSLITVSRMDEEALVYQLRQADACNVSRKVAIEDFALQRNQPSISWKDYYLDQFKRIEPLVNGVSGSGQPSAAPVPTKPEAQAQNSSLSPDTIVAETSSSATKTSGTRQVASKCKPNEPEKKKGSITHHTRKRKAPIPDTSSGSDSAQSDCGEEESVSKRVSTSRSTKSKKPPVSRPTAPVSRPAVRSASASSVNRPARKRGKPQEADSRAGATRSNTILNGSNIPSRPMFAETRHRLPLLQADIHIPDIPTRSPTPPNIVIPATTRKGANKYTQEDKDYFAKFLLFELKRDPELSKIDLCEKLGEKAPHHTAESWKNYWGSQHALADNIMRIADEWLEELEAANGGSVSSEEKSSMEPAEISEVEGKSKSRRQPRGNGASTSGNGAPTSVSNADETPDEDEPPGSEDPGSSSEEGRPGLENRPLTDGDIQTMARWIASMSAAEWKALSKHARWEPFGRKHPQRTWQAWQTHYRRKKPRIIALAQKYRRRQRLRKLDEIDD